MKTAVLETPQAVSIVAGILGKLGGRSRSPKKIAAVRRNAAKARRARLEQLKKAS